MNNEELIARLSRIEAGTPCDSRAGELVRKLIADLQPFEPKDGDVFKDKNGDLYLHVDGLSGRLTRGHVLVEDRMFNLDSLSPDLAPYTKVGS